MADQGLSLNFSTGDDYTTEAPKFKGGSWKERMRLKKSVKTRGAPKPAGLQGSQAAFERATRKTPQSQEHDFHNPRPYKRRKETGDFRPSTTQIDRPSTTDNSPGAARPLPHPGNREVISSLFSYNPTPQTVEEQDPEKAEEEPTRPSNAPLPDGIDTFTSLGLSPTVAAHLLTKMALKTPTAIQKAAVSQMMKDDSDMFVQSETGSGKTLAYLLPIVQRVMNISGLRKSEDEIRDHNLHRDSGLFAIILAPTRELCKQISVVLEKLLGCAHYIVAGTVIGGEKKKSEKARLRKGLNILVATPGRLVDHLENTQSLDVSFVRYLVLDEGDRLMDLGFEEDITKIVRSLDSKKRKSTRPGLPDRRITMLCSATLKMTVQKLGDISLKDAVLVKGESEDSDSERGADNSEESAFLAPAQLKQSYIVTATKLRLVTLTALLRKTFARKGSVMKAIVFISCADSVDFHFKALTRQGEPKPEKAADEGSASPPPSSIVKSDPILQDALSSSAVLSNDANPLTVYKLHGSLPQPVRTAIVKAFGSATTPSLLIATDVASRGLDLPNLDLVVEYDPAFSKEDHLHRIGRTARLGRDGRAIIFLLPGKEEGYVDVLKSSYKTDSGISNVTSTPATEILKKGFSATSGIASSTSDWESKATDFQLDIERWILAEPSIKEQAKKAFQSHIRAYATHTASERKWFDIKELHLGHLAKSFGLRDPPGKVNVAGLGRKGGSGSNRAVSSGGSASQPRANEGRKRRGSAGEDAANAALAAKADLDVTKDAEEAAKKMREMVRNRKRMMGAGADEFNLA